MTWVKFNQSDKAELVFPFLGIHPWGMIDDSGVD